MTKQIKMIAVGSQKMVGKDTFCKLLQELNPNIKRVALADSLKSMLEGLSFRVFNKNISALSPEQKEKMRPLMIEFGRMARSEDIDFWCKEMQEQIEIYDSVTNYENAIYCLTDLRYSSEFHFFKKIYGDSMIFINITREGAPEPTSEELIHGPEVAKLADYHLHWKTDQSFETLRPIVRGIYEKFLKN